MKTHDPKILKFLSRYVTFAGVASLVVGASVLVGWAFDIRVLKSWFPALATMKPFTAVCFILTGIALLLIRYDSPAWLRRLGLICAGGVTLIGTLTTLQYLLNTPFGFDQWLFRQAVFAEGEVYPGRPSPATAVSCFLIGLSTLTLRHKSNRIFSFLVLPVVLIGTLALVGYAYGVTSLYRIGPYSSMSFPTALMFLMLSQAVLSVHPESSLLRALITPFAGSVTARRLLPAAVVIPFILGWIFLQGVRVGELDTPYALALFTTSTIVHFAVLIYLNARWLNEADAEREAASEAMQASQTRLQITMDSMQEGCQIIGFDWRYLYLNDAVVKQSRFSREELLGHTMMEMYPGLEKTALFTTLRRCFEEQTAFRMDNEFAFPDGSYGWFELSIQPVEEGIFILSRDIGQRKQAEEALMNSERYLRNILDNFAGFTWLISPDGLLLDVNRLPLKHAGLARDELIGNHLADTYWLNHSLDSQDKIREILARAAQGEIVSDEICIRIGDESLTDVFAIFAPLRDASKTVVQILGSGFDITERKRAEAALEQAKTELEKRVEARTVELQTANDGLKNLNTTLKKSLSELETRREEMLLLSQLGEMFQIANSVIEASEVISQVLPGFFPGCSGAFYLINASRTLVERMAVWGDFPSSTADFEFNDCWALRRSKTHISDKLHPNPHCKHHVSEGQSLSIEASLCAPLFAQGELIGIVHLLLPALLPGQTSGPLSFTREHETLIKKVADDIGLGLANIRLREKLLRQSIRDPLTGLYNRRYMEETLERETRRAARAQTPLGIIMLDIDHYKQFNDTFGHGAGDILLSELGTFLSSRIRAEDIACRYGGEEFALILPGSDLEMTRIRADALREGVKHLQVAYLGQMLAKISVSLGVAVFPEHGETGAAVLQAADAALYRAKHEGRDRVNLAP